MYLTVECTCPGGCTWLQGVYLPRGVLASGVYLPRGDVPARGLPARGVPAQGGACLGGVYLPRGVYLTRGVGVPAQVLPPVDRQTRVKT